MEITGLNGIEAADSIYGEKTGAEPLDKNAFLQLLVHQMKNQDPLEPAKNEDYIAQLAQFSSLEQMENVNGSLNTLALMQQEAMIMTQEAAVLGQLTEAGSLIGKEVEYVDSETGQTSSGEVERVRLLEGKVFMQIDGVNVGLGQLLGINSSSGEEAGESDG